MNIYSFENVQKNSILLCTILTCVFNLVSFPLLLEQITARVGREYVVFGTGLVFFLVQVVASLCGFFIGLFRFLNF